MSALAVFSQHSSRDRLLQREMCDDLLELSILIALPGELALFAHVQHIHRVLPLAPERHLRYTKFAPLDLGERRPALRLPLHLESAPACAGSSALARLSFPNVWL